MTDVEALEIAIDFMDDAGQTDVADALRKVRSDLGNTELRLANTRLALVTAKLDVAALKAGRRKEG